MAWSEADSAAALEQWYLSEAHPRRRQWLHGLWLLRRGGRVDEGAAAVGVRRRTVERWVDWYRHEGGVAGVLAHRQGGTGQPFRLTVGQQAQLVDEIASGRLRTTAEIQRWVAEPFGVTYQASGVASLVARLRRNATVSRSLLERADHATRHGTGVKQPGRRPAAPPSRSSTGAT